MRPLLLRPPVLCRGASSDFSGSFLVISAKSETDWNRRPGEVGLYFLSAIPSPLWKPDGRVRWALSPRPHVTHELDAGLNTVPGGSIQDRTKTGTVGRLVLGGPTCRPRRTRSCRPL